MEMSPEKTRTLEIQPNVFYTIEEMAALLRISRRMAQQLVRGGLAPALKVGRQWRLLGRDLLSLPQSGFGNNRILTRAFMKLSEPAFAAVWDNEEDAVYDNL